MTLRDTTRPSATVPGRRRQGSVYLLTLSTTTVIATLIGGTLYAQTQRLQAERLSYDASKARLAAMSGLEIARAWIEQDPSWRTNRSSGRWASNLTFGEAKVDLDVVDSLDGTLSNHPYHPVTIKATARIGQAEQIYSATLTAKPIPIDALAYVIHTAGQLRVEGSGSLQLRSATASTNGALRNENVIEGNVVAGSITTRGNVFGTVATGLPARSFPKTADINGLIALGTVINTNELKDVTLSSTSNPFGAVNPYGIYVVQANNDLKIYQTIVSGTLIAICPAGKIISIESATTIRTARPDLPAIVARGDFTVKTDLAVIEGLLHSTGKLLFEKNCQVTGAIICESSATADALQVKGNVSVKYDPNVYASPPIGYASKIDMVLQPGSFQRVTN